GLRISREGRLGSAKTIVMGRADPFFVHHVAEIATPCAKKAAPRGYPPGRSSGRGPASSASGVRWPGVAFREHGVQEVQRVDGGGEARKDDGVDDDLFDFGGCEANVERRGEVDP